MPQTQKFGQAPFAGLREAFARLREAFARLREAIAGLREAIAGLREAFAGLREAFAGLREAFAGLREAFAGLREAIAGLREAFAGLREAFAGLHEAFATLRDALQVGVRMPASVGLSADAMAGGGGRGEVGGERWGWGGRWLDAPSRCLLHRIRAARGPRTPGFPRKTAWHDAC